MTTLEFMEKELNKYKISLEHQIKRNAPAGDIENIKIKISHYENVCALLKNSNQIS